MIKIMLVSVSLLEGFFFWLFVSCPRTTLLGWAYPEICKNWIIPENAGKIELGNLLAGWVKFNNGEKGCCE
jgi:hypothetical protein